MKKLNLIFISILTIITLLFVTNCKKKSAEPEVKKTTILGNNLTDTSSIRHVKITFKKYLNHTILEQPGDTCRFVQYGIGILDYNLSFYIDVPKNIDLHTFGTSRIDTTYIIAEYNNIKDSIVFPNGSGSIYFFHIF